MILDQQCFIAHHERGWPGRCLFGVAQDDVGLCFGDHSVPGLFDQLYQRRALLLIRDTHVNEKWHPIEHDISGRCVYGRVPICTSSLTMCPPRMSLSSTDLPTFSSLSCAIS